MNVQCDASPASSSGSAKPAFRAPYPEVPAQGTVFPTNQLSCRTASRIYLYFDLFGRYRPAISLGAPSFCLMTKTTNHSLLDLSRFY